MEKNIICCASGKSGGHIIPNLTIAQKTSSHILFFSSDTALDHQLLSHKVSWHIPLALTLKPLWKAPWHFIKGLIQSFYYLLKYKPTLIISTGSITAIPVCIAGFCLRIPIDLYELNAIPGKAITFLAPLATNLYVCFQETQNHLKKSILTDYPIRFEALSISKSIPHFSSTRKTVLILGGSQGSQSLNKLWKQTIESYSSSIPYAIQVIHQYGNDSSSWDTFYASHSIPAITFTFAQDIATWYALADLVICRAGAGSLFETLYFKKQCIIIPLEINSTSHQLNNALAMQKDHPSLFRVTREKDPLEFTKTLLNTIKI